MHFANCATVDAVLFTTLIENLKLCYSARGLVVTGLPLPLSD